MQQMKPHEYKSLPIGAVVISGNRRYTKSEIGTVKGGKIWVASTGEAIKESTFKNQEGFCLSHGKCPVCREWFEIISSLRQYCSNKCKMRAWRRRKKEQDVSVKSDV